MNHVDHITVKVNNKPVDRNKRRQSAIVVERTKIKLWIPKFIAIQIQTKLQQRT